MSQQNPFGIIGHGLNRWRDTASYGVGGIILTYAVATAHNPSKPVLLASALVAGRELGRSINWQVNAQPAFAGHTQKPGINPRQFAIAAFGMATAAVAFRFGAFAVTQHEPVAVVASVVAMAASVYAVRKAGGLKKTMASYDEWTWDWPRKKEDGGGQASGRKRSDALGRLMLELFGRKVPVESNRPDHDPQRGRHSNWSVPNNS